MNAAVAVIGIIRFPPENIQKILPYLKTLVDETIRNDGCVAYQVAEDPFDRGLIRFSELWPDHVTLQNHLKASHIGPWRTAAKEYGLIERTFTAYDISNPISI
jgi:quinol monooxygenase YgiN